MANNAQYPRPGDVEETYSRRHYTPSPTPQFMPAYSAQPASLHGSIDRPGTQVSLNTYAPNPHLAGQNSNFSSFNTNTAYPGPYQHPTSYTPVGNPYRTGTPEDRHYEMGNVGYRSANSIPPPEQYADNVPLREAEGIHKQPSPYGGKTAFDTESTPYGVGGPYQHPARKASKPKGFLGRFFRQKIPWFAYLVSLIQVCVFIAELVRGGKAGAAVQTKPQFNPMIGPSANVLINMGARYVPCMRNLEGVQDSNRLRWPCVNSTSLSSDSSENSCTLSELCGLNGVPNPRRGGSVNDKPAPNQWFRFIIPIFIHAGFIHIGFNLFAQLTMGTDIERLIGTWRFALIYMASGILGFILGGNFAAPSFASSGCSGSLFGIEAITLLDLFYTWKQHNHPMRELIFNIFFIIISFVLGLLPGLDNFSHIGGFAAGLFGGAALLRSPHLLRQERSMDPKLTYEPVQVQQSALAGDRSFEFRRPLLFFRNRRLSWWGWWIVRAVTLVLVVLAFILLLNNFYSNHKNNCSWCKYLSCLPVKNWCEQGYLDSNSGSSNNKQRALRTAIDSVYAGREVYY